MLQFVILHHVAPQGEHWDLMLERGATLATWRLLSDPRRRDVWPIPARRIGDHRIEYLTYEGPLSGDRGTVRRIDAGNFVIMREQRDLLDLTLKGYVLRGEFQFRRHGLTEDWLFSQLDPRERELL